MRKMHWLTGLVAATALALSAAHVHAQAPGKLKVGFMLPYTGTFTALGVAIENGFRLYVNEQGGKLGGREIEYVKVDDESDVDFLREHVGDDLLTWFGRSAYVKSAERGVARPIGELEPENAEALALMKKTIEGCAKDWARYTAQAVEFHLRNAQAWANAKTGEDLGAQVDPTFVLGPQALERAASAA